MKHIVIHRAAECYASFPSVAMTAGGTPVCVFREAGAATARAALSGIHTHQDNDSRIMMRQADTSAVAWSEAVEIARSDENALSDPSILIRDNGTWLLRVARWRLVPSRERHLLDGPIHRHFVRTGKVGMLNGNGLFVSDDEGSTWREIEAVVRDPFWRHAVSREAPLELTDGTLLQAVYGGWPETTECAAVLRSFDDGASWGDATRLAGDRTLGHAYRADPNFNEVSLVQMDAEKLVALIRCDTTFETDAGDHVSEGGMGRLHWARSDDAGMTWTPPVPTPIWGQPAHGLFLGDGRILCTFGHRRKPFGVHAVICRIVGNDFHVERRIVLRDDAAGWDCGYPCAVRLADGAFFAVYYIHGADGLRHIAGTRWYENEMENAG